MLKHALTEHRREGLIKSMLPDFYGRHASLPRREVFEAAFSFELGSRAGKTWEAAPPLAAVLLKARLDKWVAGLPLF